MHRPGHSWALLLQARRHMETQLQLGISKCTNCWYERQVSNLVLPTVALGLHYTTAEPGLDSPGIITPTTKYNCEVLLLLRLLDLEDWKKSQNHVTEEEKQLNLQSYPSPLQLEETQSRTLIWPHQFISSLSMHKGKLENH